MKDGEANSSFDPISRETAPYRQDNGIGVVDPGSPRPGWVCTRNSAMYLGETRRRDQRLDPEVRSLTMGFRARRLRSRASLACAMYEELTSGGIRHCEALAVRGFELEAPEHIHQHRNAAQCKIGDHCPGSGDRRPERTPSK